MKAILLFLCLYSVYSFGQVYNNEIIKNNNSESCFKAGEKAILEIKSRPTVIDSIRKGKFTLLLDNFNIEYRCDSISPNVLRLIFTVPKSNALVKSEVKLKFDDTSGVIYYIPINIYSNEPYLISYEPEKVYYDLKDKQRLTLRIANVESVNKIKFLNPHVKIYGTYCDSITNDEKNFIFISESENTVSFDVFWPSVKDEDTVKLKIYYLDQNCNIQFKTVPLINFKITKYYLNNKFRIENSTGSKNLYLDDCNVNLALPTITLDFTMIQDLNGSDKITTLKVSPDSLTIVSKSGKVSEEISDTKTLEYNIVKINCSGTFLIKADVGSQHDLYGNIEILPVPKISDFMISDSPGNILVKGSGKTYRIKIYGDKLHKMSDLTAQLVNISSGKIYDLTPQQIIEENTMTASINCDYDTKNPPVGTYYLSLTRKVGTTDFMRVYEFTDKLITIKHPYLINQNQIDAENVALIDAVTRYKGDSIPRYYKKLWNSDNKKKRNVNEYNHILDEFSPIQLKIKADSIVNSKNGPQYINITAKYYRSDGTELVTKITDSGHDYITVLDKDKRIDVRKELNLENFNVNERVCITLAHSPDMYGSDKQSISYTYTYFRGMNPWDRIGLTFSIPPYLAAARCVKQKSIIQNDSLGPIIEYGGKSTFKMQSLVINAGLGIKYRWSNRYYRPSRIAIGLYFMGMDLANKYSNNEQKYDPDNNDFIARGSFNVMFLGEYSFINIDNPNTRIPVYAGVIAVIDPIDGGSHFAFAFGLGIDIGLFGHN